MSGFGKRKAQPTTDRGKAEVIEITPERVDRGVPGPIAIAVPEVAVSNYMFPEKIQSLRGKYVQLVLDFVDTAKFFALPDDELVVQLAGVIKEVLAEESEVISSPEQEQLVQAVTQDILGFGPIEPLLDDPTVTDILINGHDKVFVERNGKIELTDVKFVDEVHLMNIAQRMVTKVGRRVDASNPMVDARLPDGSRINVAIPPASVHFIAVSIRKFSKVRLTLQDLLDKGAMSGDMAMVLQLIARLGLNTLVSGGTGSGKTTLLNATTAYIPHHERIVTIEDTAEVQMVQPDVVTMECRPANLEGDGAITMNDLLVNALRMRPDRIVVGEVRGAEAGEMLQAMNTGHDGCFGTIHANNTRDCLSRFENVCCMNPRYTPGHGTRQQIASALDIVVQLSRLADGSRRITEISEVVGIEGDVIIMQKLFEFKADSEDAAGKITGRFIGGGSRPKFIETHGHAYMSESEIAAVSRMIAGEESV